MNQLEKIQKFRVILFSGGICTCMREIHVTACDSAETGLPLHGDYICNISYNLFTTSKRTLFLPSNFVETAV